MRCPKKKTFETALLSTTLAYSIAKLMKTSDKESALLTKKKKKKIIYGQCYNALQRSQTIDNYRQQPLRKSVRAIKHFTFSHPVSICNDV